MGGSADLVVRNADVWTMTDPRRARAVAIAGGRIVAVGSDEDVLALAGPRTTVLDADGAVLLPASIDSHTHFHRAAVARAQFLDFDELGAGSIADVVSAVADRVRQAERGIFVQGDNLRDYRLSERRWPVRQELDAVAPDHPVVLRSQGKHLVVANSVALRLAGIDRDTPDPVGGKIDRDEAGEPTGVLHETAKLRLDAARADTVVPAVGQEGRLRALRAGIAMLQSFGIGTIHEIVTRAEEIEDFLVLRERGELGVRVRYYVRAVEAQTSLDQLLALGLRSGFGDAWVRLSGIKVSVDGSCESRNAALFEPYRGQPHNRGLVRVKQDELVDLFRRADAHGLQIAVHAIGPRAADMALIAYEETLGDGGNDRLRHRLEHMYVPAPQTHFERAERLGLILSEQPGLIHSSGDAWAEIYGDDGLHRMKPLRYALDLGLRVQANSDYPSSPLNPFIGVQGAVWRHSMSGRPIDPEQAVTVDEVLHMQTAAGAYTTFEEHVAGRVAPGYRADLRVLDRDPSASEPSALAETRVRLTVLDGRVVYSDGVIAPPTPRAA